MKKILIISGPTASGKTGLALKLAKELDGELISADSRQVYKEMDIVTGKDLSEKVKLDEAGFYDFDGVKVWGLDLVKADQNFDVSDFVKFGQDKIAEIQSRDKLPIIVGGTAFWIRSLLNPPETLGVPQDQDLRKELSKLSVKELQRELTKVDKRKFEEMNNSDRNNPRRLVRAIEVAKSGVGSRELGIGNKNKGKSNRFPTATGYACRFGNDTIFWAGLKVDMNEIEEKIKKRVAQRLRNGAIEETERLARKYNWDLPSMSAIGYQDLKGLIKGEMSLEESVGLWTLHEIQYAKRQMTFLNKEEKIKWYELHKGKAYDKMKNEVKKFLKG